MPLSISQFRNDPDTCAVNIMRYIRNESDLIELINENLNEENILDLNELIDDILNIAFESNELDVICVYGGSEWHNYKSDLYDSLIEEIERYGEDIYLLAYEEGGFERRKYFKILEVGEMTYYINEKNRVLEEETFKDIGFYDEENEVIQYNTFKEEENEIEVEECKIDGENYYKDSDGNIYNDDSYRIGVYDFSRKKWIVKYTRPL